MAALSLQLAEGIISFANLVPKVFAILSIIFALLAVVFEITAAIVFVRRLLGETQAVRIDEGVEL